MKKMFAGKALILFLLLQIAAACTLYAHDCSGGSDCNVVPVNNSAAHALATAFAAGTGIAVVLNNNRKKKDEKKKEEEKKREEDIDLESEFITFGEEEKDGEEEEKEKKKKRNPFNDPLGEDTPVDGQ